MNIDFIDEKWSYKTTLSSFVREGNYNTDWKEFFQRGDVLEEIDKISLVLSNEKKRIYPSIENVFRAFSISPDKIKLAVIGQDPYHNGSAVGLCFSVKRGNSINPSLLNIYKELENCGYVVNKDGDLSHWVSQGCFMLNTALTVVESEPESHLEIWYDFTEKVLDYIREKNKKFCFLLMGKKAADMKKNNDVCFITSHPSPFSVHRGFGGYPAFIGSRVFRDINEYMKKVGLEEIKF